MSETLRSNGRYREGAYPCPCCGYLVHDSPPGSYDICQICSWEDDPVQLRWPWYSGGANSESLVEAQSEYRTDIHAGRSRLSKWFAKKGPSKGSGFRPIDPEVDNFDSSDDTQDEWPEDSTRLYWWRSSFWRSE
ncbi:CPCC family cysteine-rich protein [Actinopolyspora lacussalsi]